MVLPRQGGIFDGPCLSRIAGDSLLGNTKQQDKTTMYYVNRVLK